MAGPTKTTDPKSQPENTRTGLEETKLPSDLRRDQLVLAYNNEVLDLNTKRQSFFDKGLDALGNIPGSIYYPEAHGPAFTLTNDGKDIELTIHLQKGPEISRYNTQGATISAPVPQKYPVEKLMKVYEA